MAFHPDDLPDLSGKVYIVTGATAGIGYHVAARLAQHSARVYVCARSEARGSGALEGIRALYPSVTMNLGVLVMDHTVLSDVVAAAKTFLSKETELHGLVNNAGIMATTYKMTTDGYEAQWQTNHVSHWLFTHTLLPIMLETSKKYPAGTVRISYVTSGGHLMAPKAGIDFTDTSLSNGSPIARYGQSKLANILHASILHQKYGPGSPSDRVGKGVIWTSSVHPGIVKTELDGRAQEAPWFLRGASAIADMMGGRWPADKGAWTSLYCIASPEIKKEDSGVYFERIAKRSSPSSKGRDMTLAEALDEWTQNEMARKGFL
ncbi:hypothetical protein B0I35DRAFT_400115 [Stachybotrys elegans]|uniref:Uncharacterized protein n=1 Tax=Stachybotrys elegans TaxID=80388 RepID=A0A8K0WKZ0_9HYPO|nr:hypothetical protein B0I35DRAFT_400115 [Stachybotrys elegans]